MTTEQQHKDCEYSVCVCVNAKGRKIFNTTDAQKEILQTDHHLSDLEHFVYTAAT